MYIIGKNKDYYDGVVGTMGIDKTIVYERTPIEIEDYNKMPKEFQGERGWKYRNENPFLSISFIGIDKKKTKKYNEVQHFLVGFCGKLYLGWKFNYDVKEYDDNETGLPFLNMILVWSL